MMVAAHEHDLQSAHKHGLRTAARSSADQVKPLKFLLPDDTMSLQTTSWIWLNNSALSVRIDLS